MTAPSATARAVSAPAATGRAVAVPTSAVPPGAAPAQNLELPTRRSQRADVRVDPRRMHGRPGVALRPATSPAPTRRAARRAADRPTSLTRVRWNAATAGMVLASAGLLLATATPSAQTAPPNPTTTGPTASAAVLDRASGVSARAVTAPAQAGVLFALESTGPAADGIAPSVVTARALSASVSPAVREREAFTVPVEGANVASTFGYRVNPMGGYGSELHTGIDYANACGTPVVAADDGTVLEAGWHPYGGGQRIVVDHGDGMKTSYNHLSVLDVAAGQTVARGALLGAVGSTGNSTGCHLHFEVLVNDDKVDPQPWL